MQVFITGANRGLGLEMARIYAARGATVYAAARQPDAAAALHALDGAVRVIELDVTDEAAIDAAYRAVSAQTDTLDVLVNNAGILKDPGHLEDMTLAESLKAMHVNAVAPVFVAKAFAPLLRQAPAARLVNISSQLGALARHPSPNRLDYCASKAALNMYTRGLAETFRADGVITICVHPGWVQTDMGGATADLTPQQSAEGIVSLVDGLTPPDNGGFFRWDGTIHPW